MRARVCIHARTQRLLIAVDEVPANKSACMPVCWLARVLALLLFICWPRASQSSSCNKTHMICAQLRTYSYRLSTSLWAINSMGSHGTRTAHVMQRSDDDDDNDDGNRKDLRNVQQTANIAIQSSHAQNKTCVMELCGLCMCLYMILCSDHDALQRKRWQDEYVYNFCLLFVRI